MLFTHLKRILKFGRLRLRGPRGAQDEFTLAAIAQNLHRLAKLSRIGWFALALLILVIGVGEEAMPEGPLASRINFQSL